MGWVSSMMGNLFGIFIVCYFIMWFAVPAARSARQKLEMNGERITAQSISETTAASANDVDARAKPIVADVVSASGKVVLILMKILAGLIVFGLIMGACALIIGLFAILVGGPELMGMDKLVDFSLWIPVLGIFILLIPVVLLIYVLMCLIASRKPGGKSVLVIFLVWLATIIACSCIAIKENVGEKFRAKRSAIENVLNTDVVVDGDTTSVKNLLKDYEDEKVVEEGGTVRISVPSKSVNITIDKNDSTFNMSAAQHRDSVNMRVSKHITPKK